MIFNLHMLEFIQESLKDRLFLIKDKNHNEKIVEWYVKYDDQYNIKYSFFVGYSSIISQYTLFEYGRKVITLSGDLVDGIIKGIAPSKAKGGE